MIEIDQRLSACHSSYKQASGTQPNQEPGARREASGQRGAVSILFALMVVVLFGFIGLAIDLSLVYNRKVELQTLADSAAMAAANQLVGTTVGVQNALNAAAAEAASFKYAYFKQSVTWSSSAIKFSASATAPEGSWLDAGAALASPNGLLFAKVDTSALDAEYNTIRTVFMGVVSDANATASTSGRAIAGRSSINVLPLAICALSITPANPRSNAGPAPNVELEEYGFRRGVGYDLMNLNFVGNTPANFVIDPIVPLGGAGSPGNMSAATVGPFICTGRIPRPRMTGATIAVSQPFPLGTLFNQLNSRFDQYVGGLCNPNQAQPDSNIKSFVFNTSIPWMATAPTSQTAASSTQGGKLWTVASPSPSPAGTTAPQYGPLWSFARAVPFSAYAAGVPEPVGGYAGFTTGAWTTLYNPGQPTANVSYPGTTPYNAATGANFQAPSLAHQPGMRSRRVLNIPLLACPVAGGNATVLAIGKFFMTVPATATSISTEFAGVVPEQSLGGEVELVQ